MNLLKITDWGFSEFKIKGRRYFFDHLTEVRRHHVYSYEYVVSRGTYQYAVYGGKRAGGAINEWYVQGTDWPKPIATKSLIDSLRLIDTM